jgi:hypothetical protein
MTIYLERLGSLQALLPIMHLEHKNVCPVVPASKCIELYSKAKLKFDS